MDKKKRVKTIVLIILICTIIFIAYNFLKGITTGKNRLNVQTTSTCYTGSNLEAVIGVENKNGKPIKSKLNVQLYDDKNKKVKNVKENYNLEKGANADVSLGIPDNLDSGSYTLKVISKAGLAKDVYEIPIQIIKDKQANINISLDKGIYKPGDEINFRAMILAKKDQTPVSGNDVTLQIYDGNENRVYFENAKTSDFGIVSGSFKLADEVNSGTYELVVSTESQEVSKKFNVNPYITPKFETTITTDKENYLVGDTAKITVKSQYFFGEPVIGADVNGSINGEEISGITNTEGIYEVTYPITTVGQNSINFNVTDESNYMIEASKNITAGTDIFEIELLPEYGEVQKGIDNDIYLITKTADGKGVKTYSDITIGAFSKQVISDENGIGKFTLTVGELDSFYLNNKKAVKIVSKDMNENSITKDVEIALGDANGTYIKTDKVKYETDDIIHVSLESTIDLENNSIYVFKGKELIKSVSFEGNEVDFELDDVSGLVDIYVKSAYSYASSRYSSEYSSYGYTNEFNNYSKKTIFIRPDKALNIDIETGAEEYKPGDELNVKFSTTNENNNAVDTALLISILDEAILNLAENDLSIDNLKLALEDIKLAEGMSASDLYAYALDDSSETAFMSILLKQENSNPGIINKTYRNYDTDYYWFFAIIATAILLLVTVIYVYKKSQRFKKLLVHIVSLVSSTIVISIYMYPLLEEILYRTIYDSSGFITIVTLTLSIIIYVLILYKESKLIFEMTMDFVILPAITYAVIGFFMSILGVFEELIIFILMLLLLIVFTIFVAVSRSREVKGKFKLIKEYVYSMMRALCFWLATAIIMNITFFGLLITIIVYMILQKVVFKKSNTKIEDGKIVLNITPMELIGIIAAILMIVIFMFYLFSMVMGNFASNVIEDSLTGLSINDNLETGINDSLTLDAVNDSAADVTGAASSSTNSFSSLIPSIDSLGDGSKSEDMIQDSVFEEQEQEIERNTEVVENVRNIFLESLAFIPELVTENGEATLTTPISDNITTWSIQTVGNTKAGNVGYASSSFRVFKEFFVDFSLPANSVVTDKTSIPVTLYNYTEDTLTIDVNIVENNWSVIGQYQKSVQVASKSTNMIYVPIEITKPGNNTLRVETKAGNVSDIVEKTMEVQVNGMKIEEVISSGTIGNDYTMDMIFDEKSISGTEKLKVKLYASPITQVIEGMENILEMPTGCFEQTSSSLYPDILVLKYLENNELDNKQLREKALEYISAGYQKLLTYEVKGTPGGYSLYGNSPAEPVITAFGLMEMDEMSEVYEVDPDVIEEMREYLFSNQNTNGTFEYRSTYIGGTVSIDKDAMNAYIIWALSEVCPEDRRLKKSIDYLKENVDDITDNYTLALIANVFANCGEENDAKDIIKELMEDINLSEDKAYLTSNMRDYYGTRGRYQNIQTTALASMALTKMNSNSKNNVALVNYIISSKDSRGTWGTTQSTILALKAINDFTENTNIDEQTITVDLNGKVQSIDIDKQTLDVYELEFDNLSKENKISIGLKKGKITYEVISEYYVAYEDMPENTLIDVTQRLNAVLKVNEEITQTINVKNNSGEHIENGLLKINIPQGSTVLEDTLLKLQYDGKIEKYEYNYGSINIYVRDIDNGEAFTVDIKYRALYPEEITGASIRFFDYYNPEIEGFAKPVEIKVSK